MTAEPKRRSVLLGAMLVFAAGFSMAMLFRAIMAGVATPGRTAPDFLCFWIGARAAAAGHAAALYDWSQMKAMIEQSLGHDFAGFIPWKYPPSALVPLLPLAAFPLAAAHAFWSAATLIAFLAVIYRIAGLYAALAMLACPLTVQEALMGQNGFATAAILGGALLLSRRAPIAAGLVAGVLSCKPQLFLALPFAVLTRCGWRGVAALAGSVAALVLAALLAFGVATWRAFLFSTHGSVSDLSGGVVSWWAQQSPYVVGRLLGLGAVPAGLLQGLVSALVLLALLRLEWRAVRLPLRNAFVCAATLLAAPFSWMWDFPILGLGFAFLVQAADDGLDGIEIGVMLAVAFTSLVLSKTLIPIGPLDSLALSILAWRRARVQP